MADLKVINVNIGVYDKNNTIAEEIRVRNKMNRTFLANIMASPGAGKTSVLLRTIEALRNDYSIGVMEADIDPLHPGPHRRRMCDECEHDKGSPRRVQCG